MTFINLPFLPPQIWQSIIAYLTPDGRRLFSLTGKKFYRTDIEYKIQQVTREHIRVIRFPSEITQQQFELFSPRFPSNVEHLIWGLAKCEMENLTECQDVQNILELLLAGGKLTKLKKITFHRLRGSLEEEQALAQTLAKISSLQVLELTRAWVQGMCIPQKSSLKSLILTDCLRLQNIHLPSRLVHLDFVGSEGSSRGSLIFENKPSTLRLLRYESNFPIIGGIKRYSYRNLLNPEKPTCLALYDLFANPDAMDDDGDTLLIQAIKLNKLDLAKLIIEKGADVNFNNTKYGLTPLWEAVRTGNIPMAQLLLAKGAHVDFPNQIGLTPLIVVAGNQNNLETEQNYDMAKLLIAYGADVNREVGGFAPLEYAVSQYKIRIYNLKIIQLLLSSRAEVNGVRTNMKPLNNAIINKHKETIKLLIEHGVYVRSTICILIRNKNFRTAIMIFILKTHVEFRNILIKIFKPFQSLWRT